VLTTSHMAPYVVFVFVSIFTFCHGRIAPMDYAGYSPTAEAAATPLSTNTVDEYKPQAIAVSQFSTRDYRASYQPLVYTEAPTQTVHESQGSIATSPYTMRDYRASHQIGPTQTTFDVSNTDSLQGSIATTPFNVQDYRASHQIGPTQTTFDVPNTDSLQGSIATSPYTMRDYRASHQIGPTQTSLDVPNAAYSPLGTPSTYNDAPVTIVGNNVCDACGCCEHCGSSGCTHNCPTCTPSAMTKVQSVQIDTVQSTSCACRRLSKRMLLMNVKCCKGCNCGFDYGIPNGDYHSNDYGGNGNIDYDTTTPFDMKDYRSSHQIQPDVTNAATSTYNDAPAIEDTQSVQIDRVQSTSCACRKLSKRMLLLNVKCCKGCNCGGDYDTTFPTVLPDATTVQPDTSATTVQPDTSATTVQPDTSATTTQQDTIPETSFVDLVSSKTASYCNPYTCGLQESPFYGGVGSCGVGYECPESVRKCTKCNPAKCKCKKGYKIKYTKKCGAQGVSCSCKNAKCVPITKTAFLRAADFSTAESDYDSSDYYYPDSLPNLEPLPLFVLDPVPQPEPVIVNPDPVPQPEPVTIVVNSDPVPQPEPVVVNPDPVPQPEPVAVNPDPVPQPEHVAIVVNPDPIPEPEPVAHPVTLDPIPNPDPIPEPELVVVNSDPIPQSDPVSAMVPQSVHTPVHDHAVIEVPIPFVVMHEPSTHSALASTLTIYKSSPPSLVQSHPLVRLNQPPPTLAKIKVAPPTVPPPSRTTRPPPPLLKKIDSTPPFKPLTRDSSKPSGSLHYEIHVHSTTTVGKTLTVALVAINAFTFIGLAFL
jgi:hypothetical protein